RSHRQSPWDCGDQGALGARNTGGPRTMVTVCSAQCSEGGGGEQCESLPAVELFSWGESGWRRARLCVMARAEDCMESPSTSQADVHRSCGTWERRIGVLDRSGERATEATPSQVPEMGPRVQR